MAIKLGFTSVTFRHMTVDEILDVARDNGISYIEWGGDVHLPPEVAASKIITTILSQNIPTSSYGSYYRVGQNDMRYFDEICKITHELDAKIVRVWLGDKSSDATTNSEFDSYVSELLVMSDIAKKYDVTIAFEFHNNTYNDSADSCLKILTAANRGNVRTYWQPLGKHKADRNTLSKIVKYIVAVHLFYWKKSGVRMSLKSGTRVWSKYLDIIKKNNIHPIFIMEFVKGDDLEQFRKDVVVMRAIIEKLN